MTFRPYAWVTRNSEQPLIKTLKRDPQLGFLESFRFLMIIKTETLPAIYTYSSPKNRDLWFEKNIQRINIKNRGYPKIRTGSWSELSTSCREMHSGPNLLCCFLNFAPRNTKLEIAKFEKGILTARASHCAAWAILWTIPLLVIEPRVASHIARGASYDMSNYHQKPTHSRHQKSSLRREAFLKPNRVQTSFRIQACTPHLLTWSNYIWLHW